MFSDINSSLDSFTAQQFSFLCVYKISGGKKLQIMMAVK